MSHETTMNEHRPAKTEHDSWYKHGVRVLIAEMVIAIGVCGYSLTMAFAGIGGFPGKG